MSHDVVPIHELQQRMTTAGRIRIGTTKIGKSGKPYPVKLDTFRFTSHDRTAIDQLAALYGGTVAAWSDGHGEQWEVVTEASEVSVVLPPDPLQGTPIYELWSGGGCMRRCDGIIAEVPGDGQDAGMEQVDCLCVAEDTRKCAVKTRLSVIIPDIQFAGVWRLDSSGWNVAKEMPGMVDAILALQSMGMPRGLLAMEQRQSKGSGKTKNYVVPVLRTTLTPDQMVAGGQLPAPDHDDRPALPEPTGAPAEVVDVIADVDTARAEEMSAPARATRHAKTLARAHATFHEYGWDYETQVRPAIESFYGVTLSKLTDDDIHKLVDGLADDDKRANFTAAFPSEADE